MQNPVANPDQFAAEAAVDTLWEHELIRSARQTVGVRFVLAYGEDTPPAAQAGFAAAMDEWVGNYLLKAFSSDASHPKIVRGFMAPYAWQGRQVRGSRIGGDNPDNCYRLAGVEHGGRYRLTGRVVGKAAPNVSFNIMGDFGTSQTIALVENHQLETDADGGFVVTIDGEAADGRANHLQTRPGAKLLYVRDSHEDWASELPYDLKLERLDPTRDPLSLDEVARRAAFRMVEDVPLYYWFHRIFSGMAINGWRAPMASSAFGGLVTQAYANGRFRLADDEAVVVRYRPAGAAYAALALGDWWYRSIAPHERQTSLTQTQSVVGDDGWIEAVIAHYDPGLANWLDAAGEPEIFLYLRWQGLPGAVVGGGPTCDMRVVKLADLAKDAAGGAVTAATRAQALQARRAAWSRRTGVDL